MGGLAVLHPQDCLIDRHQTFINSHMKPRRNPNPNSNANPTRSNRRKRSPEKSSNNKSRHTVADNFPAKNLVMGQVKILKRREELTVLKNLGPGVDEKKPKKKTGDLGSTRSGVYEKKPKKKAGDLVLSTTAQDPTEPEMMTKQMRLGDFYAGSAIIASPPPSSLPLPAFFAKRSVLSNEDATTDLRRLLRLSLV